MSSSSLSHEFQPLSQPAVLSRGTASWDRQSECIIQQLEQTERLCRSELEAYAAGCQPAAASFPADFKVSIVIPVYNEEATIAQVVARVATQSVIEMGDRHAREAEPPRRLRHEVCQRRGVGAARARHDHAVARLEEPGASHVSDEVRDESHAESVFGDRAARR